jgi:hypothetical protein
MPETERGTQHFKPKAETPKVGKNYLLAIGIDDYKHWQPLRSAENDVKAIVGLLADQYEFAQPDGDQTKLLLNKDATRGAIIRWLNHFEQKVKAPDNLVVYFAGHGDLVGKKGYWIPQDGLLKGEEDSQASWLLSTDITSYLGECEAQHIFFIIDSCFSATLLRNRDAGNQSVNVSDAFARPSRYGLASGALQPVPDGAPGGHTMFTSCLLNVLKTDHKAYLPASELCVTVKKTMADLGEPQQPNYGEVKELLAPFGGMLMGEFVFYRRPAPLDINQLQAENQELRTKMANLETQLAQAR